MSHASWHLQHFLNPPRPSFGHAQNWRPRVLVRQNQPSDDKCGCARVGAPAPSPQSAESPAVRPGAPALSREVAKPQGTQVGPRCLRGPEGSLVLDPPTPPLK